jgi:hypothetical protein
MAREESVDWPFMPVATWSSGMRTGSVVRGQIIFPPAWVSWSKRERGHGVLQLSFKNLKTAYGVCWR